MFARTRSLVGTIFVPSVYRKTLFCPKLAVQSNKHACNTSNSIKVVHDPAEKEFRIDCNGNRAFLQYEMEEDLIKVMHTVVPESLGGKGLAKELAKAALNHIEKHNYRVESQCSFFSHFVKTSDPRYLKYLKK